ncbi:DinB family protein [Sinomicrobium weinanense]|uniref:DinB family protein n=1 Tax=Sinomicrobium weinanense TaxID=2842200 RepID=A0A926Q2W3_9FLAO|nr:DinB family protein [Sinomicrobium weinanense]MBC9797047.1 DinB family protein [Sinomicrobium weinanense]MBU3122042.1 DinB family protein [Sinomicrobium weinanense]
MSQEKLPTGTKDTAINALAKNYASYNLWANTRLVEWLRTKPESVVEREVPSSFPSIKLTLAHIWQTERYWYSILKKEEPKTFEEFNGTPEDAFTNILQQSSELADYINSLTGESIEEKILIESPWFTSDFPGFEYVMHCVTHSTYHRGQVITIGRNLGFTDAPMTDYNLYNVERQ